MENLKKKKYGHGLIAQPMETGSRKDKSRTCRACGNGQGIIRKYHLMCCRQCFRSNAKEIGFSKNS